jgi:hypothetical protein
MLLTKEAAAVRQLDTAISMLFQGGDVVSIQTLAAAAANVFSDLLRGTGRQTWKQKMQQTFPGREKEVHNTLHLAQNFFKHADNDPTATLDFDPQWNDDMILVGILEYGEIVNARGAKLTHPMSIFQLWYFARNPGIFEGQPPAFMAEVHAIFPNLPAYPRFQQLELGGRALRELRPRDS